MTASETRMGPGTRPPPEHEPLAPGPSDKAHSTWQKSVCPLAGSQGSGRGSDPAFWVFQTPTRAQAGPDSDALSVWATGTERGYNSRGLRIKGVMIFGNGSCLSHGPPQCQAY